MKTSSSPEFKPLKTYQKWIVVSSILYSIGYFTWRANETVNTESYPAYSWIFYAFDLFGFISSLFFMAAIWRIRRRVGMAASGRLTVDAYIPTYNESPELLKTTIQHVKQMNYPHETYVLDDGNREEIKALATEMGVHYLTRSDNTHAKAGNLNRALQQTKGDLIAVFDADGIPHRDFLLKTVGYFEDAQVALVQTPNAFYNLDSFQHWVENEGKKTWHEQALWYDVIQRGLDYGDAAVWCGSGSIVRRESLQKIGGIATESVTEDMLTTLRLHEAGLKTVYHDEPLAYNLAPTSLEPFLVQRGRWAMGSMQILRKNFFKLIKPNELNFHQRLGYLQCLYYLTAIQKSLYYLAPFLFLVFGIAPVHEPGDLIWPLFGYVVLATSAFKILARGTGRVFLGEVYFLHLVPIYLKAIVLGLMPFFKGKFRVTSKDPGAGVPWSLRITPLIVAGMCSIGISKGIWDYTQSGVLDYGVLLTMLVAAYYLAVALSALTTMGRSPVSNKEYSFFDYRPISIQKINDYVPIKDSLGIAFIISKTNLQFVHMGPLPVDGHVELDLDLPGSQLRLQAQVQRCEPWMIKGLDPLFIIQVELKEMNEATESTLSEYFFEDATPKAMNTVAVLVQEKRPVTKNLRNAKRLPALLPVIIESTKPGPSIARTGQVGLLVDVSEKGARLKHPEEIALGSKVRVQLPWLKQTVNAMVVRCHREEGQAHAPYDLGIEFTADAKMDIQSLANFKQFKLAVG